ncbi:MAG: hypothetical protein ACUVQT_03840 [bacterium]
MSKIIIKNTILICTIICLYCAHKGTPLHVDRINPRITKITPINNHQLMLYFSEELDSLSNNLENFVIYTGQETLKIYAANPGNTLDQIFLTTEKMKQLEYEINGKVYDKAGRIGIFLAHFTGSTKPDTVAPWVTRYSKGSRLRNFSLEFSEPVDTISFKYYIIPKRTMQVKWQQLTKVSLTPLSEYDSFHYDTTYYLFIKDLMDLSGNHAQHFITSVTPDTIYNPLFIRGKALLNDTIINDGIAIIERERILGISMVKQGEYLFEVRDSLKYLAHIIIPNFYGAESISVSQKNVIILNPGAIDFDSLIN